MSPVSIRACPIRRCPNIRGTVAPCLRASALGEPPEDPLLLFTVLYGVAIANYTTINGDALRELSAQFLARLDRSIGAPALQPPWFRAQNIL
jgi:hypothetical protein